jgi:hypothetical protein
VREPKTKTIENNTKMNEEDTGAKARRLESYLEELKEEAKAARVSMRDVAIAIKAPATFFCPSSIANANGDVIAKRLVEGMVWVRKVKADLSKTTPPKSTGFSRPNVDAPPPPPAKTVEAAPESEPLEDVDPIARINYLANLIKLCREEIRRLALAL